MVSRRIFGAVAVVAAAVLVWTTPTAAAGPNSYRQFNLRSDIPGRARETDADLVNPWGMAAGPSTPVWVSDEGTAVTTLYTGGAMGADLDKAGLVVGIPDGHATGQVFNPSSSFVVDDGNGHSGPALFIFASLTGEITGWNPAVPPPPPSTQAQPAASKAHAVYTGLAINTGGGGDHLYAANFHSGRIDVYDGTFTLQHWVGAFRDPRLPDDYAPFNIQNLNGVLYVAYAKKEEGTDEEETGLGRGFVDAYDLSGNLLKRVASGHTLNAPWGLAIAPAGFGKFSGNLLVGNFGDGRINAYKLSTDRFKGQLRKPNGNKIQIPGLWGLMFGNGTIGSPQTLVFTAGIRDERHGLMGTIEAVP